MKYSDLENEWLRHWFQFIKDIPDKDWHWQSISSNPNITWKNIQQNPDKEWSWYDLSCHPNVTWEIIQDNPDKPWDWYYLAMHSNLTWEITWEIIQQNPDKPWEWDGISRNIMELGKKRWLHQRRLEHVKAFQIQKHWRNYSSNPEFKLAQRCLLRLYESQLYI